jgi:predicted PurR-regulated permease PerM
VLGALLAIPLAATVQIAGREYLSYREAGRSLVTPASEGA